MSPHILNTSLSYDNIYFSDSVAIYYYPNFKKPMVGITMPNEVREMNNLKGVTVADFPGIPKIVEDFSFDLKVVFESESENLNYIKEFNVYIKSPDFVDPECWYKLRNWERYNPELFMYLNKGVVENCNDLEMVHDSSSETVKFLDRNSEVYKEFLTFSNEREIASLSRKTSKRVIGNCYFDVKEIGNNRKAYYLGQTWKLIYDKVSDEYKKVPQDIYVRNIKEGEKETGEIIKDRYINEEFLNGCYSSYGEFKYRMVAYPCSKKRKTWVDLGPRLKESEFLDIRDLWVPAIENYMKNNKTPLGENKYSTKYYYEYFNRLLGLFTIYSLNTDISQDRSFATEEVKDLLEHILEKNYYSYLYDLYTSPDNKTTKLSVGMDYFRRMFNGKSLTPETLVDQMVNHPTGGYFSQIGYSANIEQFWVEKVKHVKYIFGNILGVDLIEPAKKAVKQFLDDIQPKPVLTSLSDVCTWTNYITNRIPNHGIFSVSDLKSKHPDEIEKRLGDIEEFELCPTFIHTIQEIFTKACFDNGSQVYSFRTSRSYAKGKRLAISEIACQITLENIIDHFGGLSNVPLALEKELLFLGGKFNQINLRYSDE